MKFFASASMLLAVLPVATVNAELKCCWPINVGNYLGHMCDDMLDVELIQQLADEELAAAGDQTRRRLAGGVSKIEDLLKKDQLDAFNEKRQRQRALVAGQRRLKKIDLPATYAALATEECKIPGIDNGYEWGACEPCGTSPWCLTNFDVCDALMDVTVPLIDGEAHVTSTVCEDDQHDCCAKIEYTGGAFLGANFDSPLLIALAVVLDPNPIVVFTNQFLGFGTLEVEFNFATGHLFSKICPKLYGDLCCQKDCEVKMDPHFKTWEGEWYDFQGECDLQFIKAPEFGQGVGLDVQIRTRIRHDYSFIEAAAVKVGDDILEVSGWGDYMFNGVASASMPAAMGHVYSVTHEEKNKKEHKFGIALSSSKQIVISTYKDFVNVQIYNATESQFDSSTGLMGSYQNGALQGRDGVVFTDMDAFGQEWQVRDTEGSLFEVARAPQYPNKCILPNPAAAEERRLGETIAEDAAALACSHLSGENKDMCVFDVMATGDLEVAHAGAY